MSDDDDPQSTAHGPLAEAPWRRRRIWALLRPGSLWRAWWPSFALLSLLGVGWSLATPITGAPDEPAHLVRAVSLVHGELLGQPAAHKPNVYLSVRVPRDDNATALDARCFAFRPDVPAGCVKPFAISSRTVQANTYAGRYPPLYYAVVGWPSLFLDGSDAVYAMRILSALFAAAFLALAFAMASVLAGPGPLVTGIAVALTPLALFVIGSVNPNGAEMATAICAWTAAAVVCFAETHEAARTAAVVLAGSMACAVLLTTSGPLWMLLLLLVTLLVVPGRRLRLLARERRTWATGAGVVAAVALAGVWDLYAHPFKVVPSLQVVPAHASLSVVVQDAFGRLGAMAPQLVGVFGWLTTRTPMLVLLLWWAAAGAIILLGVAVARRREGATLLVLFLLIVGVPLAIIVHEAHRYGLLLQGRDILPLVAGLPILAAGVAQRAARSRASRLTGGWLTRLLAAVVVTIALAQVGDFVWALRRNTVGLHGPLNLFGHVPGGWSPPGGAVLVVVFLAVATVGYAAWLLVLQAPDAVYRSRRGGRPRTSHSRGLTRHAGSQPGLSQ
jgi:hypothetical protein